MRITLTVLLLCLGIAVGFSLDSLNNRLLDFARAHPPQVNQSLDVLSQQFATVATTDYEKAEIAFYWIAEHFELDFSGEAAKADFNLNQLMSSQRAGIRTFSQLYRDLCTAAGLEAYLVPGYMNEWLNPSENWEPVYSYKEMDLPSRPYHTWNVVKVASTYQFVDLAFGFGAFEGGMEAEHFVKRYDLTQVLEPATTFNRTHLPADPCWQLSEHPVSIRTYYTYMPYEEMLTKHAGDSPYDYAADIRAYELAGEAERQLLRLQRSLAYHPAEYTRRELANAYASRAYEIALQDFSTERMILARRYYQRAIDQYRELPKDGDIQILRQQAEQGIEYVNYRLANKQ